MADPRASLADQSHVSCFAPHARRPAHGRTQTLSMPAAGDRARAWR